MPDLKEWLSHFYAECFCFFGASDSTSIIIAKDDYRLALETGPKYPLARDIEVIAIQQREHYKARKDLTEQTTTPHISSCWPSFGLMSGYVGFSGRSIIWSYRDHSRLHVKSPSTSATTISPCCGRRNLSTTSRSPSKMPAPVIESPRTLSRNVHCGCLTMSFARSSLAQAKSSAGLGKPARTGVPGAGSMVGDIEAATGRESGMWWGMAKCPDAV
ncbi:hypothetical protein SAMN05216519_3581 [Delftia acidovorans]|nr:hypothetical protein SAMN05216519_3581 [Delftia acidovorans]